MSNTEKNIKINEYKKYIADHINNVVWAYHKHFEPLKDYENLNSVYFTSHDLSIAFINLDKTIEDHDKSKYSLEEFEPYRKHFYPTEDEKSEAGYANKDRIEFEKAWTHHYKSNPHHPQYWQVNGINHNMPLNYIIEMLCDWIAMGNYFNTSTKDWYENKAEKEKSFMTENTKKVVEELLYDILDID